jgi:hypothetical protein
LGQPFDRREEAAVQAAVSRSGSACIEPMTARGLAGHVTGGISDTSVLNRT